MSDVGLGAAAAVVFFGGLIYLANRLNQSEIRRTHRKHLRELVADSLTDLRASGDRIDGMHDGVPIRVEGGWTPGTRLDEVVLTTSATIVGGRLARFTVPSITEEHLAREGLPTDAVPGNELLLSASLTCDGTTIAVRTTRSWSVPSAIALVARLSRAPHHALSRLAVQARLSTEGLEATHALRLGSASRPVIATIDRGLRLTIVATPLEGLTSGSIDAAIESLGDHVRVPELEALSSELMGRIDVGEGVSFTLHLSSRTDHLLRAVELVERLTQIERSAFR